MFKVSNNPPQEKLNSSVLKWNNQSETRDQSVSSASQLCPTLRPHGLQHTRLPCQSPTPGVHSDLRPSTQ